MFHLTTLPGPVHCFILSTADTKSAYSMKVKLNSLEEEINLQREQSSGRDLLQLISNSNRMKNFLVSFEVNIRSSFVLILGEIMMT